MTHGPTARDNLYRPPLRSSNAPAARVVLNCDSVPNFAVSYEPVALRSPVRLKVYVPPHLLAFLRHHYHHNLYTRCSCDTRSHLLSSVAVPRSGSAAHCMHYAFRCGAGGRLAELHGVAGSALAAAANKWRASGFCTEVELHLRAFGPFRRRHLQRRADKAASDAMNITEYVGARSEVPCRDADFLLPQKVECGGREELAAEHFHVRKAIS